MRKILVTPASFWPFERELIKNRPELRISGTADDRVIDDMIQGAVDAYEQFTGNILCRSTWDFYPNGFPESGSILETPAPLAEVTSIIYLDSGGGSQVLSPSAYKLDLAGRLSGRILLKSGYTWPTLCDEENAVVIRMVAGYENAAAIPQIIKDGLLLKMQETYDGLQMNLIDRKIYTSYELCWAAYRRIPV